MKRAITTGSIAWAATIGLMGPLHAADIDLFTTSDGIAAPPNVYLMIDNSANWNASIGDSTKNEMEHQALYEVFIDSAEDGDAATRDLTGSGDDVQIRLGLGLFSDGNKPKGGVVFEHVEDYTDAYKDELKTILFENGENTVGEENLPKTNNAPYALSFNEAYQYFADAEPQSGTEGNKVEHDPDAIDDSGNYISPAAGNCGKNFVILMGNGEPDSGEDGDAEDKLTALGGKLDSDPIDVDPDSFESNWSDEYARFLAGADVVPEDIVGPDGEPRGDFEQNVRTYVIDVFDPDSNQAGNKKFESARSWLKSIAKWGDGRYFTASSEEEIREALTSIIDEILAVNSVFASSTLPVSVNVRGTNLNQVYMGVFRPSGTGQTRWQGNLKLYQLALDEGTNSVFLADQNGDEAQSQATGFIRNEAVSFWTHTSSYWDFDPRGTPESGDDRPDGPVVEKGGAHQQIRDLYGDAATAEPEDRPLHTFTGSGFICSLTGGCAMDDFDTSTDGVNSTTLGTSGSTEAQALVDWVHGRNNVEDDTDPDTKTIDGERRQPRPSVHGDVLHSAPAVINYGDITGDGDSDIFVFYGANDGIFHALRGGKKGEEGDGEESWGFIPPEFFDRLKDLRDRDSGKTYFADGGVGILKKDANDDGTIDPDDGDKVHIFIGMRRGGPLLYALDVTDPSNPEYLWKATPDRDDYGELGQTWSAPEVTEIRYKDADNNTVTKDVLVFGGGYDPAAEDPNNSSSPKQGRAIFVVDAEDGSVIWQATKNPEAGLADSFDHNNMTFPIPSDVTLIDSDGDGVDDRLYVGDTGGQVWRGDISGPPDTWDVHRLASVGEAAGLDERKFLFPPDVVFDEEPDGTDYHAVLLGSGDREAPFKDSVTNRFYMFKDKETGLDSNDSRGLPLVDGDLFDATDNAIQDGDDPSTAESNLNDAEGWFITLENAGEKVVSSAVTLSGTTFFNTNEPPDAQAACSQSLGTARFYEVSFDDGTATVENDGTEGLSKSDRTSKATGGGFPPSPVPVIVEIGDKKYQAVISGTETKNPSGASLERRNPVYREADVD